MKYAAQMLSVHDGDTVHLDVLVFNDAVFHVDQWRRGQRYRFDRMNAPELSSDAGKASAAALAAYCASQPAVGWTIDTRKPDQYGRYIIELYAPDGTNVNDWMVAGGWAKPVQYHLSRDGRHLILGPSPDA